MEAESDRKAYPIEEALRAQKAMRQAAGLDEEQFPLQAFVGMVSDEIDELRERGFSDEKIAGLIREHSKIEVSAKDIAAYYAPPEERKQHGE